MKFRMIIICFIIVFCIGSFINAQEISKIIRRGDLGEIKNLIKEDPGLINRSIDSYGWTPLIHAVESKNLETVKYFIKNGADINKKSKTGWSPLSRAVEINDKVIVTYLLTLDPQLPLKGKSGIAFVHKAARGGFSKLTELLINEGVEISSKDKVGNTLLHSATIGGLDVVCKMLINKGCDVNKKNNYELAPLHFAAIFGKLNVVKTLVKNNAKIDIKSFLGKTPLHFAVKNSFNEVAGYLSKKNAIKNKYKFPVLKGEYLGQKKPGKTAELFAQGIISTYLIEHGICVFSKEGDEVYWSQRSMLSPTHSLMYMKRINNKWLPPEKLNISKKYSNSNPILDPNSGKLIYASSDPLDEKMKGSGGNLLISEKVNDTWSQPKFLDPVLNSVSFDSGASLSKKGTLYFNSGRAGGVGLIDLYVSYLVEGKYTEPKNLGKKINTDSFDCYPFIAPDESYLIFEAYRAENIGRGDLYICFQKKDGTWDDPKNMGLKINSKEGRETFPYLSPDGKYFFFSSDRKGNLDSYWIDAKIINELKKQIIQNSGQ